MVRRVRVERVDKLLDLFPERLLEIARRTIELEESAAAFMHGFVRIRDKVILPMMNSIGRQIEDRGHGYRIEIPGMRVPGQQPLRNLVTMAIQPYGLRSFIQPRGLSNFGEGIMTAPSISYLADGLGKKIWLYHCCTISGFGSAPILADELDLAEITVAGVEAQIVGALEEVFNPSELTPQEKEARIETDTQTEHNML